MATTNELLTQLRARLRDDHWSVPAFTLVCQDRHASACLLTIENGFLQTTVENGSADVDDLSVPLVTGDTKTLGGIAQLLATSKAYKLTPVPDWAKNHASDDLEPLRSVNIMRTAVTIRTRRFSDAEMLQLLQAGIARHNPRFTSSSVPAEEVHLVLTCAHVEALRVMATDAAKRRGMQEDASTLLNIAQQLDSSYRSDVTRLARTITPQRSDDDGMREGDVVVGTSSRLSLRSGKQAPGVANNRPTPPQINDVTADDAQDYSLTVRWRRSSNSNLSIIELWRDETPNVRRSRNTDTYQTTSKLAWSSVQQTGRYQEGWGTVDRVGELIGQFQDGFMLPTANQALPTAPEPAALEPNKVYYYRLYIVDRNGEYAESAVVQGQTKAARARFDRPPTNPLSVATGLRAGGTAITITGKNLTETARVLIGGKECGNMVVGSATSLTCTAPATGEFTAAIQDVVIESNSGLIDVLPDGWTYT